MDNPTETTQQRIIAAAEVLFAERGFAATSLRAIASAAGVNLAAANYHFGSKQGLLAATLHARVAPINAARLRALDELEQDPASMSVNKVMDAFFLPFASGELNSALPRIMARIYAEPAAMVRPLLEQEFLPTCERFIAALLTLLPHLDAVELRWRFHFTIGSMIQLLTFTQPLGMASPPEAGVVPGPTLVAIQRLQQFVVAGLQQADTPLAQELQP
jgi:AcrR family transcriptional regulator